MRSGAAKIAGTVIMYILQSAVLVIARVITTILNLKRSCSLFDYIVAQVAQVVVMMLLIFFIVFSIFMFGGFQKSNIKNHGKIAMITSWFMSLLRLILMSLGIFYNS
jgi:hypothetical protein